MSEISYVVVFPNIFSKNKIPQLMSNIKKILKIKNQKFKSVKRDGDVVLVDANDPVFASSAVNLLFGIEKVVIARQVKNEFKSIISEISFTGGNLLLKNEKFLVRVEGAAKGFVTKDVEMAATSSIIEKKTNIGAHPGTEQNYDKLLYMFLTKKHAYMSIFSDKGNGGIPYQSQKQKTVCALYDELSAVSCYETIKQGYDAKIVVFYRQKSELTNLAKTINQIIPRLIKDKVDLEFYHLKINPRGNSNYLVFLKSILHILLQQPEKYVSLALPPVMFSSELIENLMKKVFESGKIPIVPLSGLDSNIFHEAKEIGLGRNTKKLEKMATVNFGKIPDVTENQVKSYIETSRMIKVEIGPNNVHDILDALLEKNH